MVAKWVRRFKEGRESVGDDERPGCPIAATADKETSEIKELIETDAWYTVEELAQVSGISLSSV